jgi:hypothetical protein
MLAKPKAGSLAKPLVGVVLCEGEGIYPWLVWTVWHDWDLAGEHLQRQAAHHPDVDLLVEWAAENGLWRAECLGAAHSGTGVAHVRHWEGEAVLGEDKWLGLCDRVSVTIAAPVDLTALWVLSELLRVTGQDVVVGKPEQDVVELEVGVDEFALDVQEVEGLEGVHEDLPGEGGWDVAPTKGTLQRSGCLTRFSTYPARKGTWGLLGCYELDVRLAFTRVVDLLRVGGFQR